MTEKDGSLYRETIQEFLSFYRYLRRYGRQMQQEGLSGRKVTTLRYLAGVGPLTIGELSGYLCISNSSTSLLIDKLEKLGLVDTLVPEPLGGAHRDKDATAANLKACLIASFKELEDKPIDELLAERYERIRNWGAFKE